MSSKISIRNRLLRRLWGSAIGDALGVPVEFRHRAERERDPVRDLRGYGTHNQPPGTWSDDTSLTLCTVDTLVRSGEDYHELERSFVRWRNAEIWTPHGVVFDIGNATADAIANIARGTNPLEAGQIGEWSNGNGSLMRILPVGIWFTGQDRTVTIDLAWRRRGLQQP